MRTARATLGPIVLALLVVACGGDAAPSGSGGVPNASGAPIGSGAPNVSGLPVGSGLPGASQPAGPPPAATTHPAAAAIGVDAWVSVQAESLNLREAPGTGSTSFGFLAPNSVGLVVAGPEEADGYTWYALAAPGLPYASGCITPEDPRQLTCPTWFGWAAVGDANASWVVPAELQCPAAPTSVAEYILIPPGLRLACFRGASLTLDAFVAPSLGTRECVVPYELQPQFLHPCARQFLQADESAGTPGSAELEVALHPDLGACDYGGRSPDTCPYVAHLGQWITVVGHVDDPQAAGCSVNLAEPSAAPPDPASVVYTCRTTFVVTEVRAVTPG